MLYTVKTFKFKNMGTRLYDKQGNPVLNKDGSHKRGEHTIHVEPLQLSVKFGEECEIPEEYTRPTLCVNGSRGPSPIEQLAPQLEPVDALFAEEWRKAPPAPVLPQHGQRGPSAPVTVESLMASGLSKGLAEQMYSAIQQARTAKVGS
jgi:hypothetical protein